MGKDSKFTEIHFEDNGQDFLFWVINEKGLVVDSQPFQASVWRGFEVDMSIMEAGKPLVVFPSYDLDNGTVLKHLVKEVKTPTDYFPFWDMTDEELAASRAA